MDIALDVLQMKNEGKDIKEIRARIAEDYGDVGQPTPTPPIE